MISLAFLGSSLMLDINCRKEVNVLITTSFAAVKIAQLVSTRYTGVQNSHYSESHARTLLGCGRVGAEVGDIFQE